jgi:hypothetical protein
VWPRDGFSRQQNAVNWVLKFPPWRLHMWDMRGRHLCMCGPHLTYRICVPYTCSPIEFEHPLLSFNIPY